MMLPYVGLPEAVAVQLRTTSAPRYLLTIENQSSFNEYLDRYPNDGGIILYCGGFPSRAVQQTYRHLAQLGDYPLFHWGDTDVSGFRILALLQRLVQRSVTPHQMDHRDTGEIYSDAERSALAELPPINPEADRLIAALVKTGKGKREQETETPELPFGCGADQRQI